MSMTSGATGNLNKCVVPAGTTVQLKVIGGDTLRPYVVLPDCGEADEGHWSCVTHANVWLRHGLDLYNHIETGKHRVIWVCHKHGPESVKFD